MKNLAAAQFNEKTREIILGESGPYHPDWQRVLIYPESIYQYLNLAKDAEKTLQEMTHSHNEENPWLGITAAVALLQQNREPLYCDVCGEKLQRESCNHVRACVKCNQQKFTITKGVLPRLKLDDEYCPKCGDGNGCDCERSNSRPMPHVMRGEVRAGDETEKWVRVKVEVLKGVRIGERVAIVPLERDCQCGCADCPICMDVRSYVAEVLKERHPAAPVEKPEPEGDVPADWLRWRIYKHQTDEHEEYLKARFPEGKILGDDTFMLRNHRWKYHFTSFDDGGEYDLLVRPRSGDYGDRLERAEKKLSEIIAAAEAAGWNGVTNSKILTEWIKGLAKDRVEWKPKYDQLLASEMLRYEAHNLLLRGTELRAEEAKKDAAKWKAWAGVLLRAYEPLAMTDGSDDSKLFDRACAAGVEPCDEPKVVEG